MAVNWEALTWGQEGHNVHEDSTGSWVRDRHNDDN